MAKFKKEMQADIVTRLNRAEGQFKGIQKMVSEERDFKDIVEQISALKGSVDRLLYNAAADLLRDQMKKNTSALKKVDDYLDIISKYGR
jgi:DNA-binding FrmR family transcriptional regulator